MSGIIYNKTFTQIIKQSKYKLFIFDCDGVMWINYNLFKPAETAVEIISSLKKDFLFLTNNNVHSTRFLYEKLAKSEIMKSIVKEEHIFNSINITSRYIKHYYPRKKKLYVIGQSDMISHFRNEGYTVIGSDEFDDKYNLSIHEVDSACIPDKDIDGIVVGFDIKINYFKIAYALRVFKSNPDVIFFGTNIDSVRASGFGYIPGTYISIKAIEECIGRKASIVTKPSIDCFTCLLENVNQKKEGDFRIKKENVLMIGDKLSTDVKFANNAGVDSVFVLTGVDKLHDLEIRNEKNGVPTYVVDSLI